MQEKSDPKARYKILLTEGSSTSARQTLYALGGRYTIDVLDPNPLCQCRFSKFVRHWYRCPPISVDPEQYLRVLGTRLRAESYDVLFPTHEQAYLLARVRHQLQRLTGVALPAFEAIDTLQDKAKFSQLLTELGMPQPETKIISSSSDLWRHETFPCFLKLAHGTAGSGVAYAKNFGDMSRAVERWRKGQGTAEAETEESEGCSTGQSPRMLIQQPARGTLSILQAVFQHGHIVGWHDASASEQAAEGAPVARVSTGRESVLQDVAKLGAALRWHGALFFEYFFDETSGTHQFLEANPRIGETLNATLAGVNLADLLVQVSRDVPIDRVNAGAIGVRSHQGFTNLLSIARRGGSRLEVATDLFHGFRGSDRFFKSENELTRMKEDWMSIIPAAAVSLAMLVVPKASHRMVSGTVGGYSVPPGAARRISALGASELETALSGV